MRRRERLIILSGLPGTGKSVLAEFLAGALDLPVFSVDPIESALLASGVEHRFTSGLAAYNVCVTLAEGQLLRGQGAIIDAVNAVEPAKEMWRRLAAAWGRTLVILECVLSDEREHRRRLSRRARGLLLPEPTWDDIERRRSEYTPWNEPVLVVDGVEPLEVRGRRALAWIRRREREAARPAAASESRVPRRGPRSSGRKRTE